MRFLFNSPHILIRRIAPLQQWTTWDLISLVSYLLANCTTSAKAAHTNHFCVMIFQRPTQSFVIQSIESWLKCYYGCCMLWLRYSATFLDFSVAMKFTEWHIVHVYPAQCSTNFLKLYNAAYIQFSLFSLFVFHTFFFLQLQLLFAVQFI